jgi:hypothetical protein
VPGYEIKKTGTIPLFSIAITPLCPENHFWRDSNWAKKYNIQSE